MAGTRRRKKVAPRKVRKQLQELKSAQYQRVADYFLGAIRFNKQFVSVPAHDYGLVMEALAGYEENLTDLEWRETVLEALAQLHDADDREDDEGVYDG